MKRSKGILKTVIAMWVFLLVFGTAISITSAIAAEKYPAKAVTVIHGFKPGGGSDQLAQVTQPFLEKILKQRIVNAYKPGATGAIAWKEVSQDTKPDG